MALLLRKKEVKKYIFMGDLFFKLVFSIMLTAFNQVYIFIVYDQYIEDLSSMFSVLFFAFNICFLSSLVVMPVYKLYKKVFKVS